MQLRNTHAFVVPRCLPHHLPAPSRFAPALSIGFFVQPFTSVGY
ncbi:hypothetical protein [Leeia oryzae]|nr:hypothetical protein [Leeia oryzae]